MRTWALELECAEMDKQRRKWGRNMTLSWGLGVGMSCPLSGSRCAMSLDRYPAPRSFSMCPSVTEEAIHLPPAPDMFGEG